MHPLAAPASSGRRRLLGALSLGGLALVIPACQPEPRFPFAEAAPDWNPGEISWRAYEPGFAEARAARKHVVLILYTDWCPHCHNYSRLFHDPEIVALARGFVMIRVERDGHPELSRRHDLDGDYVPRTFFLEADGQVMPELDADRDPYRYFLDEYDPSELASLMREALAR